MAKSLCYSHFKNHDSPTTDWILLIIFRILKILCTISGWFAKENPYSKWYRAQNAFETSALELLRKPLKNFSHDNQSMSQTSLNDHIQGPTEHAHTCNHQS
jgi:hypothetical protein